MTDAERIVALEDKIGRLERVIENVLQREVDGSRVAMAILGTSQKAPRYTRDTDAPFTADEIARMTGGMVEKVGRALNTAADETGAFRGSIVKADS